MTMRQMYPAVTNSPGTELAADITATDTEITVLSASGLPPAPNLLTIGSDETAETVRYTAIEGDVLTVERGFQGTAKAWSAGTKIARNFTAYDHDTFIENIAQGTIDEREDLTLQTGVQIIDSEQDTPFNFGSIEGRTEIREGDGIVNVTNPYAIATGDNLLPPFYEWEQGVATGDSCMITAPYTVTIDAKAIGGSFVRYYVPVPQLTHFTLSVEAQGSNSKSYMYLCRANKSRIDNVKLSGTVSTTNETAWIEVVLNTLDSSGSSPSVGVAKYANPMLTVGTEAKPFKPQQRSMWATECQLAANPLDGTNADVLFTGDDGLPYVLEKWKKVMMDGSLPWQFSAKKTGFTEVKLLGVFLNSVNRSGIITKYDGSILTTIIDGSTITIPDAHNAIGGSNIYLTISNTDSGWGDAYTPTADEIKAYFLGWRMTTQETWNTTHEPYNNSGTKGWGAIYSGVGTELGNTGVVTGSGKTNTPTVLNSYGYTPYRLQYAKTTSTVEPVRNYETGLTLCSGSNVVEVGSGIVIRERANPVYGGSGFYYVNTLSSINNPFKHKTKSIRMIYANQNEAKSKWIVDGVDANGDERAKCAPENYDPTAVYHVTYTMLAPTLSAPINGNVATNLRGTVSDLVQRSGNVERRLSVVENQKAEKDAPQRITTTMLNGWQVVDSVGYYKDSLGIVHIDGAVASGTNSTVAFTLPAGYRPKQNTQFPSIAWNGTTWVAAAVTIRKTGEVFVDNNGGVNKAVIDVSFLAE